MDLQRLVRPGTPAEVSVAAVMAFILGAGCLLWAGSLMAEDAPRGATAGLGLVGVAVVVALLLAVAVAILTRLNARLRADAHIDSLTGLLNRNGFALAAERQRAVARRRDEALAVAVLDLDDFKVVNDREGHAAGDRLLVELTRVWTASLRPGDLLARFGGDEFVLMVSGGTGEQVNQLLARLARAHPASWTAGVVVSSEDESLDEAVDRADGRLYIAKQARRHAIDRDPNAGAPRSWQPRRA